MDRGIYTRQGKPWVDSNVKVILTNITYTGNMLFQKEYCEDPITKHRRKNYGELPQYFVEDTHEAIIPMDEWQAVQAEFKRRRDLGPFGNKSLKLSAFSTKITCGCCGKHYRHSGKRNTAGEVYYIWTCQTKSQKGASACPSKNIPEKMLQNTTAEVLGLAEFDEDAFREMILALPLENTIVGILRTINDRLADAVYCDELRVLYGRDYYMEKILGLDFKVSAFSFFQTNVAAVENLYSYAISLIDDFENKTVFDLYCGTGTITQTLAKKAGKVIGIELVEEAVKAAEANAALNGLENCEFIAGDVFEVLKTVEDKPDVIVVDPPRAGISSDALDKIISYGVDQIVYISCNPKTLVENLYYLQYYGYRIVSVKPFDNFPGTKHTECVALLARECQ